MRNAFGFGFVLLITGACVGLYWPLVIAGALLMSVAFASVYLRFKLKGNR